MIRELSRRQFVRQVALVTAAAATGPLIAFADSAPSKYLRMSSLLMEYHTRYGLPLCLLEPRAKAAWRLRQHLRNIPPHSYWAGDNFDWWTRLAAKQLHRSQRLKEAGTLEALAEYRRIAAVIGDDVIAEYEWGISQPPQFGLDRHHD